MSENPIGIVVNNAINHLRANPLDVVKFGVSFVVGAGTKKIVHRIIENNRDLEREDENFGDRVSMNSASYVAGALAANVTKQYTDSQIDLAASMIKRFNNDLQEAVKTAQEDNQTTSE